MSNIELATLDELLDEIANRLDDFVFYGRRKVSDEGTEEGSEGFYSYSLRWKGHRESGIFLTKVLEHEIIKDHLENKHDPEPWEEL